MRPRLLAGLVGVLLLAPPAMAAPRHSPWSASVLGGPVTLYKPYDSDFDNEFALRASVSRRVTGRWYTAAEAGFTRFGFFYDPFWGDEGPTIVDSDGEYLDSFDISLSTGWHPNRRTIHPYVIVGGGAHAVYGYFPEANALSLSRQIRPGAHAAVGLHGVVTPMLGMEARWLTIYDGRGSEDNRHRDMLSVLFSLTKE